jgi:peptidyl-prolyl cis-trans isomerase B (cyclophilin B)
MKVRLLLLLTLCLIVGCAQNKEEYLITINTPYGAMKAVLYDETPLHKENFIKLVNEKYFDSLLFHRVIQGFMIQGGDPDSKNAQPGQPLGQGGPNYTVKAEIKDNLFHEKGALAAARLGDEMNPGKESSGSQFYIVHGRVMPTDEAESLKYDQNNLMMGLGQMYQGNQYPALFDSLNQLYASGDRNAYEQKLYSLAPRVEKTTGLKIMRPVDENKVKAYTTVGGTPSLDGGYTVFGKVISGIDVIDKIALVSKGDGDRPVQDVRMTVTLEKTTRAKIEKEFGYTFGNGFNKK